MYCLSAGPSRIVEDSANRVGEPFKVFFTGTIYDDAAFEPDGRHPDFFQHDQIVESEMHRDDGPARISTDPQCWRLMGVRTQSV
jgi:hypothetical protein